MASNPVVSVNAFLKFPALIWFGRWRTEGQLVKHPHITQNGRTRILSALTDEQQWQQLQLQHVISFAAQLSSSDNSSSSPRSRSTPATTTASAQQQQQQK